ncbi:lysozyme inhibitor LprI family protein [Burkholderia pseudomultivorans]|uniref:lysozyme inhibitor LprI family protein n=1 Tax=Burkholderia pseudomultivorans TaxID=1207504 RepID=UPI0009BD33D5|nr:lysozyme inhibitor LprI family protein [Burkholderia pseudomultivorans]
MVKNIGFCLLMLVSSVVFSKTACDAQTNTGLADCAQENYRSADKTLNRSYSELLGTVTAAEKQNLIATQRAWITYKEKYCNSAFDAATPGAEASVDKWSCLESVTEARTSEIRYLGSSIGMNAFRRSLTVMAALYENGDVKKVISKLERNTPDGNDPDWVKYVHLNCGMTAAKLQEDHDACVARLNFFKNW